MGLRKDSDSFCIQAVLRTHPEAHVVFAISREGPFCVSDHQTCPEINTAPSHLHVSHEVPHCKWLHSSGHLLLPALPWTLALPWGRIMTGYFTPHPQLPCPASSPVLFALETLSCPGKTLTSPWACCSLQNSLWPTELGSIRGIAAEWMGWDNIRDNAKAERAVTEESWCTQKFEENRF